MSAVYKQRKKDLTEKQLFKEKGSGGLNKKRKEGFLTALATVIKKDLTTSIRKNANELKVDVKIKQDLSPVLNLPDFTRWGVLENKTNETSHSNTGSLKTTGLEEWNIMSEKFILKTCKLFPMRVDTIIKKKW